MNIPNYGVHDDALHLFLTLQVPEFRYEQYAVLSLSRSWSDRQVFIISQL